MKKAILLLLMVVVTTHAHTCSTPLASGVSVISGASESNLLEHFVVGMLAGGVPPLGQSIAPFVIQDLLKLDALNARKKIFCFVVGEFTATVLWSKLSEYLTNNTDMGPGFRTYAATTAPWLMALAAVTYKYPRVLKPITG